MFVAPIILGARGRAYWGALTKPIYNKRIMVATTILLAVLFATFYQAFFAFDIFARIIFALVIFAIFALGSLLLYGKGACPVLDEMDNRFSILLRKVSSEVPYE